MIRRKYAYSFDVQFFFFASQYESVWCICINEWIGEEKENYKQTEIHLPEIFIVNDGERIGLITLSSNLIMILFQLEQLIRLRLHSPCAVCRDFLYECVLSFGQNGK